MGGEVIGVGQGHSRRVAETEAAAHAIEGLRHSSENRDGASPELAEFLGCDGDDGAGDWGAGDQTVRASEPWTEFDLESVGLAPKGETVEDPRRGEGR